MKLWLACLLAIQIVPTHWAKCANVRRAASIAYKKNARSGAVVMPSMQFGTAQKFSLSCFFILVGQAETSAAAR
jgi:hypothetical protein